MEKFSRGQLFLFFVMSFLLVSIFLSGTVSSWLTLSVVVLSFFAWHVGDRKGEKV